MTDVDVATADALAAAAARLAQQPSQQHVLDEAVRLVVDLVDGADHASVTVPVAGGFRTPAATGDVARHVDAMEYELDEGPCLVALRDRRRVVVDDLRDDERWPRLSARAAAHGGPRSVVSLPLDVGEGVVGSLNVYGEVARSLPAKSRAIATLVATQTALALAVAREHESSIQLRRQAESTQHLVVPLRHHLLSRFTAMAASMTLLLRRSAQLDARGQEALQLLAREVEQQNGLVLDLLELARAASHSRQTHAATPLLRTVKAVVREHHQPVDIVPSGDAAALAVDVDEEALRAILLAVLQLTGADSQHPRVVVVRAAGAATVIVDYRPPRTDIQNGASVAVPARRTPTEAVQGVQVAVLRERVRLAGGELTAQPGGSGLHLVVTLPLADSTTSRHVPLPSQSPAPDA